MPDNPDNPSQIGFAASTRTQTENERALELAVLKTLGFSDATVFGLVISETLLLCLVAAVVGIAASSALFPFVSARPPDVNAYVGSAPL